MLFMAIPALIIFLIAVTPILGDIYTWTDANGVKHFSNEPPPEMNNVRQQNEIKHDDKQYKQWDEKRSDQLKKALKNKPSQNKKPIRTAEPKPQAHNSIGKVVVYTTPTCGYCKRAKAFFAKHNIAFTEYDITTDAQAKQRYQQLQGNGVPLIYIGENRVAGFNESRLRHLLKIK
jgi:glutaredoxin